MRSVVALWDANPFADFLEPSNQGDHMFARLSLCVLAVAGLAAASIAARSHQTAPQPTKLSGDYVEIRSCDVYTGPCFANAEMHLGGREAIMAWSIRHGAVDGVAVDGLKVIAVIEADGTLGDVHNFPQAAHSVLIVDQAASAAQRDALVHFAKSKAANVLGETVNVQVAPMSVEFPDECSDRGCSLVQAGDLVNIKTRCLGGKDHVCGNEELYYPPLTTVNDARPAFTLAGAFSGKGLGTTFNEANRRSAYLATFTE
jgi:hypothetical protein